MGGKQRKGQKAPKRDKLSKIERERREQKLTRAIRDKLTQQGFDPAFVEKVRFVSG